MANGQIAWGGGALKLLKNAAVVTAVVAATVVGADVLAGVEVGETTIGNEVTNFWQESGKGWLSNAWEWVYNASHAVAGWAGDALTAIKDGVIGVSDSITGEVDGAHNAFSQTLEDTAGWLDESLDKNAGKAIAGGAAVGAGLYTAGKAAQSAKEGGFAAKELARRAASSAMPKQKS